MNIAIRSRTPTDSISTTNGVAEVLIVGATEVEIEIVCSGVEAQEIMKRLEGMPGVPRIGEVVPGFGLSGFEPPYATLAAMDTKKIERIAQGDWGSNWQNIARNFLASRQEATTKEARRVASRDPNFAREIDL